MSYDIGIDLDNITPKRVSLEQRLEYAKRYLEHVPGVYVGDLKESSGSYAYNVEITDVYARQKIKQLPFFTYLRENKEERIDPI